MKDKESIEHLKHEVEVGKQLHNENVIEIYEFNNKHGRPFIAMELFNAKNVKQELRDRPAHIAYFAPEVVKKCALGLDYLHEQGWVHCDIKPDNYLVDNTIVKLIDFAIAQPIRKKGGFASMLGFGRRGAVSGTRSYMSPEQIRGEALGREADIYSLGCTMFEIFSSKPPFAASNANELLQKHLRTPAPSVQAQNNRVSTEFSEILMKMMAKDPAKRFDNLKTLLKTLDTITVYRPGMRPDPPPDLKT